MTREDEQKVRVADCYRICRNFQDYGAAYIWSRLQNHFKDLSGSEIAELIIEVERIVHKGEKPTGCF